MYGDSEKLKRAEVYLNNLFKNHNWTLSQTENNINIYGSFDKDEYTNSLTKQDINKEIIFRESPWYNIPIGSDHEGSVVYWDLYSRNNRPDSPHILIGGRSGSGKSYIQKQIIKHLVNNCCKVDIFTNSKFEYSDLDQNYCNLVSLPDSVKTDYEEFDSYLNTFLSKIRTRFETLEKLNASHIDKDCTVEIDKNKVLINDFAFDREFLIKLYKDEKALLVKAGDISNDTAEEIVLFKTTSGHEVKAKLSVNEVIGNRVKIEPMFLAIDGYNEVFSLVAKRKDLRQVEEIQNKITRIASIGRAANAHLIISTQTPSVDIVGTQLKNNVGTRILCGSADINVIRMVLGMDVPNDLYIPNVIGAGVVYDGNNTRVVKFF